MRTFTYCSLLLIACSASFVRAHELSGLPSQQKTGQRINGGCGAPVTQVDLDISGVRATILTGGDMWWDLSNAKYEVPKQTDKTKRRTSMFCGTLWIGGYDVNSQLHTACQFYRQSGGNDFWPGPLDTSAASITPDQCLKYDRLWKLNRIDVVNFAKGKAAATADMLSWPGNGDASKGQEHYLAPFFDKNGDGIYDPSAGDYPSFDVSSNTYSMCDKSKLPGDQVLWWVFNDAGNSHLESKGAQIGLEIHAMAFAMVSKDEDINNTTFYRYKIINRGSITLYKTYFGIYADPDLGWYKDDYVGCDANLGLGFCYNGKPFDHGGSVGYNDPPFDESQLPPAIGIDFIEGPFADANGKDDPKDSTRSGTGYGDGIIDNERLGMERFMFFNNNNAAPNGNPGIAQDFYNYLTGIWKDGKPMRYGGNGYSTYTCGTCKFMFPDTTDLKVCGQAWTEITAGNPPDDRRFIQSAGPFTLKPGAVNYVSYAVVWAQAKSGNNLSSVTALKAADKKVQALIDGCLVTSTTGIANLSLQKAETSIFPNPFSTAAQVFVSPAAAIKPLNLKITDITGRCVRTYYNVTAGYVTIERADLKSGTYLYILENDNTIVAQGKMLVE